MEYNKEKELRAKIEELTSLEKAYQLVIWRMVFLPITQKKFMSLRENTIIELQETRRQLMRYLQRHGRLSTHE